jgi:hypothetical protein
MRFLSVCCTALALAGVIPAFAAPKTAAPAAAPASTGPKEIARSKNWIAATHTESGHPICYAFTRAGNQDPATGTGPVLSVTNRSTARNEVAIGGGPVYPKDASITLQVDQTGLDFYTAGHDAFARDGKATVAAFEHGTTAVARVPGPHGPTTISFNLDGFKAAHDAMEKACPGR